MLLERLCTAIPLILLIVYTFLTTHALVANIVFAILSIAMIVFACKELNHLLIPKTPRLVWLSFDITCVLFLVLLCLPVFLRSFECGDTILNICLGLDFLFVLPLAFVFPVLLMLFRDPSEDSVNIAGKCVAGFFYIVPLAACTALLFFRFYLGPSFFQCDPRHFAFATIIITKMGDIGAYFVGCSTAQLMPNGNHKLCKKISPKKSWEGLLGGTIFSVGAAFALAYLFKGKITFLPNTLNPLDLVLIGIIASVVGLFGDLVESAFKRAADVKDSGHIPGIGGILDMLDSLVFAVPAILIYCALRLSVHFAFH